MNATSVSPSERPILPVAQRVLVWDAPVRVFHWLMVLCFAGAWLTAESERQRLLHVCFGYSMAGLVGFRLIWGFLGSRYARFAEFVRGPRAVSRYLKGLLRGAPEHFRGHNPAGAVAILLLLGLTALVALAGHATYEELAGDWTEELHEGAAYALLLVVGVHVLGVLMSSVLHRENLVRAMISGRKTGGPHDAIGRAHLGLALLLLLAVIGFWVWQLAAVANVPGADATVGESRPCESSSPKTTPCSATASAPGCASAAGRSTGCATAKPPSAS